VSLLFLRDFFSGAAILAGMGFVYTSLGTLNGRLVGGFTVHNLPRAVSGTVFLVSVVAGGVIKLILLARRRGQAPLRMHPSGKGWVPFDETRD
jgi:hypothetical protein